MLKLIPSARAKLLSSGSHMTAARSKTFVCGSDISFSTSENLRAFFRRMLPDEVCLFTEPAS